MITGADWVNVPLPGRDDTSKELYSKVWSKSEYTKSEKQYPMIDKFIEDHGIPDSALDVGCGRGHVLRLWRKHGLNHGKLAGCDIAIPDMLEGDSAVTIIDTGAVLPYYEDSYEFVSMLDVIEHMHPGEDVEAMNECLRVSSRWVLLSICTCPDGWGPRLKVGHLHVNLRPIEDWIKIVDDVAREIGSVDHTVSKAGPTLWSLIEKD